MRIQLEEERSAKKALEDKVDAMERRTQEVSNRRLSFVERRVNSLTRQRREGDSGGGLGRLLADLGSSCLGGLAGNQLLKG